GRLKHATRTPSPPHPLQAARRTSHILGSKEPPHEQGAMNRTKERTPHHEEVDSCLLYSTAIFAPLNAASPPLYRVQRRNGIRCHEKRRSSRLSASNGMLCTCHPERYDLHSKITSTRFGLYARRPTGRPKAKRERAGERARFGDSDGDAC